MKRVSTPIKSTQGLPIQAVLIPTDPIPMALIQTDHSPTGPIQTNRIQALLSTMDSPIRMTHSTPSSRITPRMNCQKICLFPIC